MFLRRCQRRKRGKVHTYWALVESRRTQKGSRQRVVTYLGELKRSERSGWAELGRHLDRRQRTGVGQFERCASGATARLRRRLAGAGAVAPGGVGRSPRTTSASGT